MQKNILYIDKEKEELIANQTEDCYILSSNLDDNYCRLFVDTALKNDKIVLFMGNDALEICQKYKGDGIIVELSVENIKKEMETLRNTLGKDKYIGVITRSRRHESMLISEQMPDFIIFKIYKDGFENLKELTDWYNEFFLIQSAAWPMEEGIDTGRLNTDFIIKTA